MLLVLAFGLAMVVFFFGGEWSFYVLFLRWKNNRWLRNTKIVKIKCYIYCSHSYDIVLSKRGASRKIIPSGVVHANVGQKRLNCNIYVILSIFLTDRSRIFDATFMRCDRFQKSITQTFPAKLVTPTKYHIVLFNSFRSVWYVIPLCY